MHSKILRILLIIVICPIFVFGQIIDPILNQNATNIKFSIIKSSHFNLIFPCDFYKEAQKTINYLENAYQNETKSLGAKPKSITIILQNNNIVSNAFVSSIPRYSEFYTNSPQNAALLGNGDWMKILASHEFRHIVQYQKAFDNSKLKIARLFFGDMAPALMHSLKIPNWFKEGDAVGTETCFTDYGRGRIPTFDMLYRSNLLSGRVFNYSKAVCGSYKDQVPNWYVNGYFLTTAAKNKFGINVFDSVLTKSYGIKSFSNALKIQTKMGVTDLFKFTQDSLKSLWSEQIANLQVSPAKMLNDSSVRFTSYEFPKYLSDSSIVALKSGLDDIDAFVKIDSCGIETVLTKIGYASDRSTFGMNDSSIVWSEYQFDKRWRARNYSVVKLYDFKKNKIHQITSKSRLFAPDISEDNSRIVAVKSEPSSKNSISVIDVKNGKEISNYSDSLNSFFLQPKWFSNSDFIVVKLINSKKSILSCHVDSTITVHELFEPRLENISNASRKDNFILYNSSILGIDNVFTFDTKSNTHSQLTNRRFGAFNANFSKDRKYVVFNDFNSNGFKIAKMPFDESKLNSFDKVQPVKFYSKMVDEELIQNSLNVYKDSTYSISNYRKTKWTAPYGLGFLLNNSSNNAISFGLQTQDYLSNYSASVGLSFNQSERTSEFFSNISYQGFYPILDFSYTNGTRSTSLTWDKKLPIDSSGTSKWNQQQIFVGTRIPWILTHSKFSENLLFSANVIFTNVSNYNLPVRSQTNTFNGFWTSMNFYLKYSRLMKLAPRDVDYRRGQTFLIYERFTPNANLVNANLFALDAAQYLPGLGLHDNIKLRFAKQMQGSNNSYQFSSPISFARGYTYASFKDLNVISLDYHFPVCFPDWELGKYLYVKRVKMGVFTDHSFAKTFAGNSVNFNSSGIELSSILNVLRFPYSVELGMRISFLSVNKGFVFQPLLFNLNF